MHWIRDDLLDFELIGCDDVGQAEHPLVHGDDLGRDVQASADIAHDGCFVKQTLATDMGDTYDPECR